MKKDWEIKTLEEVCDVVSGFGFPKTYQGEKSGEIPFLKVSDMNLAGNEKYINTANHYVSVDTLKKIKAKSFPKNTIIFPKIGAAIGTNKKRITTVESTFDNNVMGLAVISDGLDLDYLYAWITNFDLNNWASKSELPSMRKSEVEQEKIPVPPLTEQKRIVKILDEKFRVIEGLKKVTEQQIVDVKELFEIRLGLIFESLFLENDTCVMSDIYDVRDGTHDSPKYQTDGYPLITSKNLKEGELLMENIKYISESDYLEIRKRSGVSKGDVLFAMIGTIGNPVVIKQEPNFAIKNVALFKVSKKQNSNFLRYYLISRCVIDKMKNEAKGATQQFVGLGYLRLFPIPCVDLNIQNKIVKELDELSNKTKELAAIFDKKISDLGELKKSYLEQAFSGEL